MTECREDDLPWKAMATGDSVQGVAITKANENQESNNDEEHTQIDYLFSSILSNSLSSSELSTTLTQQRRQTDGALPMKTN
ncbi:unnamed protein product [Ilex paraguariensis]|uniref:Uncharacterized protein n=1 Tax=Ilex paraguariensis TaxID=185542 RepID=A0ABC8QX65_9AQUA